jgi:lipid A 3-O-deacylase
MAETSMLRRAFLAILLSTLATATLAQERPRFASFTLENDFFAGTDRHYTNGLQLAFVTPLASVPAAIRALPPFDRSDSPEVVFAVGQRIYTPADIESPVPDPHDRPYAGWLYGLADVQTRNDEAIDHVTITFGVVGPAAFARQTQDAFHVLTGSERVEGWNSQLRNEPAFTLGLERAWPAVAQGRLGPYRSDLALRTGITLGNVLAYANAGTVWRVGTALPADFPATHISLGPPRDGFRGSGGEVGWYGWLGADARLVARNLFIDGNTFQGGPHVKREVRGYDLQWGAALAWPTMRLSFTLVQRGREFEGQRSPDRFGQLALSLPY